MELTARMPSATPDSIAGLLSSALNATPWLDLISITVAWLSATRTTTVRAFSDAKSMFE